MAKRLYVCNLPYNTTEQDIRDFCAGNVVKRKHGRVGAIKMVIDRDTSRFRGFAFIDLENDVPVEDAIYDLDGAEFGGREIGVQEAREKVPGERGVGQRRDARSRN